jgi:hypothetical protein
MNFLKIIHNITQVLLGNVTAASKLSEIFSKVYMNILITQVQKDCGTG